MQDVVRRSLAIAACLLAVGATCLPLCACASNYDGPITNEVPHDDTQGPPLLNGGFAP